MRCRDDKEEKEKAKPGEIEVRKELKATAKTKKFIEQVWPGIVLCSLVR